MDVLPVQLFAGQLIDFGDGLQHGDAVLTASAKIVDFTRPRIRGELFDSANNIVAVNVVAHLFGFVTEYGIGAAAKRHLDEIRQEAMKFHAGVRRAGKAAATEDADL